MATTGSGDPNYGFVNYRGVLLSSLGIMAGAQATFSGTGSQTVFATPHGLSAAPLTAVAHAGSAGAASPFYVTFDATNITFTYTTAPASGANVVINWAAKPAIAV